MPTNVKKIYISNFLVGLVFWYGIEKLFMQNIGINAVGIGIAGAVLLGFNLIFDIPSGVLADRWSRKGMLIVAAAAMAASSLVLGLSNDLTMYIVGYVLYGVYCVSTSGTFQAIMYDSLYEHGIANQYSKINGRAYALFLVGAGVANVASGFIATYAGFRTAFFMTVIPCLVNVLVIASIKEPTFHKAEQKEKITKHIASSIGALNKVMLLRGLAIIMTALAVVELFKSDYGQLYMLRYMSSPELLGILWAAYSFTWAFGSLVAHRLHAHLNVLVIATILPLVGMAFIDNWFSLVLFMIQSVATAALLNQIETRVQDITPSGVRASIISVLSSLGRLVSIPASIGLGWLIYARNIMWALYAVAVLGVCILGYWWWLRIRVEREKAVTL